MLLYNTGSRSAGDFIPEESDQQAVITLDLDQQETSDQKNQASMLLYNTGSWTEGDFIPNEPGQHGVI